MATLVRLTQDQIEELFAEADRMEQSLKELHEEFAALGIPDASLSRLSNFHDRFTSAITYLKKQRELGGS
ncbi:hypothetical protein [Devosia sp. FJ2-5-3]|jgi:hypothetical protein|uniref:hypothetical protein n=1 Tax=Devosia sp. FJ2-5-3 TaxID=2976680 RepID=UPI0023D86F16|nr:hypothetical protein [Devosia sp. FJ2-5-3]WEJ56777.1 hypothetical protein N0P34_11130 [Devosia sp. FJ2-5-3]